MGGHLEEGDRCGINNQLFIMLGVSSQPEEGLLGLSVGGALGATHSDD